MTTYGEKAKFYHQHGVDASGPSSHTQKWQGGICAAVSADRSRRLDLAKQATPRTFSWEIDHISLNSKHSARNAGLAMNSLSGYLVFRILDRRAKLQTVSKRKNVKCHVILMFQKSFFKRDY